MNPIQSALSEWKTARKLLAKTIVSYQAACATLSDACISPLHHSPERTVLEGALNAIDSELGRLTNEESRLYNARISLAKARNRSTTLVHINAFPPEIFTRIFALSRICCIHSKDFRLYDLTSVCTYWRQLAINTPALWTHIDISSGTPKALTRRLLERAGNSVLHVHVQEPGPALTTRLEKIKRVQLLAPHIHRVRTLDMAPYNSSSFFGEMLTLWLRDGDATLPRSLSIYQLLDPDWPSTDADGLSIGLSGQTEQALPSLSALHLQNVWFDWDSKVYHGLVDLRLQFSYGNITVSAAQLVCILSASPALQTLKLGGLSVHNPGDGEQPVPISLPHLNVLNLAHLEDDSLLLLLPLITLPAEVSVGIGGTPRTHEGITALFDRSLVTVLYFRCKDVLAPSVLASLLNPLRHLRTFIAHKFVITANRGHAQATSCDPPNVTLLGCTVNFEGLKGFVAEHGTKHLRLENCMVPYQCSSRRGELNRIRGSLLEIYPALQCSISDTDSTKQLPCRTMFHGAP